MTDRPACDVQPGMILTGRCACGHRVAAHSPAPGGPICNVCVADENEALRAENARLRAGADPTPREEAAQHSPGQLWHHLTTIDPDDRLQLLGRILRDLDTASTCFVLDHEGQVGHLKAIRDRGVRYDTALRDIVATLGPDSLCTCHNPDPDCGLRDEAAEALRIARAALGEAGQA